MSLARRLIALLSALCLFPLIAVAATGSTASASGTPAAGDSMFTPLDGFRVESLGKPRVSPREYLAYETDLAGLRSRLAPSGPVELTIPDPAGTDTTFTVVEDSVMEAEMQAAHPDIRTYEGTTDNGSTIRFDITPFGFHAMVKRPDGVAWYVDPVTNTLGEDRVLSYAGAAMGRSPEPLVETGVERAARDVAGVVEAAGSGGDFSSPGGAVTSRTYKIAFLTDPTYAAYYGSTVSHAVSDPLVLAAKTSLINRINQVYNDDVAYEFELVNGTDTKLNLLNAAEMTGINGPCGANACFTVAQAAAGCSSAVLTRNIFVLGQLVGADTFDIGHIGFGLNGGGIAELASVGKATKARGCTGLPDPTGDFYAIDYVAHEMGHQMGGNHTFNSQICSGNRNAGTSVEPGSGSSIMAYAGICGNDNLQPHSDPYFSFTTINEFEATTAAALSPLTEQQVVNFTGLTPSEEFTVSCTSCGTSSPVAFTGTAADAATFAAAVTSVTSAATVTGYDVVGGTPSANGFTATWAATTNQPTLVIAPSGGASFTTFTGVLRNGGPATNGGDEAASTNTSPVVTAPADKTIPKQTPFTLEGSATDGDADTLTYLWEQTDPGQSSALLFSNTKTSGPLFRQFGTAALVSDTDALIYNSPGENLAGTSPSRTFPDLAQVVGGTTNAATGTCPLTVNQANIDCFSEFLPTSDWTGNPITPRVMHFRLTARDEFTPDGGADDPGGVSWDDTALTVDPATGPFLVTSRGTAGAASGFEEVTWSVAGTNTSALAQNVRISLSTDGGLTFPTELVASTPNDGSHVVTLPNVTTSTARIKVEAVDNYFFDINDADFSISPAGSNLPPLVDAGPDGAATVGVPFSSSGSFTDETPGTAEATVDYGDGSGPQTLTLTGSTFTLDHTYATPGTKTVTVTVTDDGALSDSDTATVTVSAANVAPVVDAGPDATVTAGAPFSSSGSFIDESPGTATATVDYGDGSGTQPLTLTGSTFNLNHTYATAGAKTVTVTVTDGGSLSDTDTATVTVNPATVHLGDGKGTFFSKKGSSKAAKQAAGKARFRFTADTTGSTPSGSARFKFKLGKVKFAGTAVTSATVSGKVLTMTVTGTNNGKSGFTLVLAAKDGAKDKIRVRMLKGSRVRYDSMPGKPASAKPRTKLMGGNITVV